MRAVTFGHEPDELQRQGCAPGPSGNPNAVNHLIGCLGCPIPTDAIASGEKSLTLSVLGCPH